MRTLDSVVRLVLGEQAEQFLLSDGLVAVRTLFLKLNVERILQDLTQLDWTLFLGLRVQDVVAAKGLVLFKQFVKVVFALASSAERGVVDVLSRC